MPRAASALRTVQRINAVWRRHCGGAA